MDNYYVNNNAQANGDHEVHKEGCYWGSLASSTHHLGQFFSCHGAVAEAKLIYTKANGCAHCSPLCHTS